MAKLSKHLHFTTNTDQPINQAPASSQIPPDPETSPNTKKTTSPNGSYILNQGNPRPKFQSIPTPPSGQIKQGSISPHSPPDPAMPPKNSKYTSPNGIHSQNQGHPWQNFQPSPTSLSSQTKQASASTQIPPDPETPPKPIKCTSPNGRHGPKQWDPW